MIAVRKYKIGDVSETLYSDTSPIVFYMGLSKFKLKRTLLHNLYYRNKVN